MCKFQQILCIQNKMHQKEQIAIFLNRLDILADHNEREKYETASPQKIDELISDLGVFNENGQKFSMLSSVQRFRKFGPGVFLMFHLIKYLVILFGVLSLIISVQFFLLMESPYYKGYGHIVRMNLLRLTIASLEPSKYQIYIFFDFLITLSLLGWLIWWKQYESTLVDYCNKYMKLPSYLTATLDKIPQNYSQDKLKNYLEKHQDLHVEQIYTAKNFRRSLNHYKKLTQLVNQFRVSLQLSQVELKCENNNINIKHMVEQFIKICKLYKQIQNEQFNYQTFKPNQVFIIFHHYHERQLALNRYGGQHLHITSPVEEQDDFQGQSLRLSACQVQPNAIAWENIGIPLWQYMLRAIFVLLLLSLVTCLGVILIFILEILETASIGDAYYFSEKQTLKAAEQNTQDYCLSLSPQYFLSGQATNCSQFKPDYFKLALLIILAPFAVFLCKKAVMFILSHFVSFRKFSSEISKLKSQIITLSFFYFIVSAVLHLVLYLKAKYHENTLSLYQLLYPLIIRMFDVTNYNPASIHLYSDFSLDWYKEATFFVIIIGATSFNIANCWKLLISVISRRIQIYKAKKQTIIYRVQQRLHGVQLHIEGVYSSAIAIVYFSMLYCSAIPITFIFGFISLLILYSTSKYVFVKHSQNLIKMSHSVNKMVTYILMGSVVVHCIMAPIFFGARGIGVDPQESHKNESNKVHAQSQNDSMHFLTIGQRYLKFGPYYITILCIMFIYIFLHRYLRIIFKKLKNLIKNRVKKAQKQQQSKSQNKSQRIDQQFYGLYPSYSMHNNQKYAQILKNIYTMHRNQAKRNTCKLDKNLQAYLSSFIHSSPNSNIDKDQKACGQAALNSDINQKVLFYRMITIIQKYFGCSMGSQNCYQQQLMKKTISKQQMALLQDMFRSINDASKVSSSSDNYDIYDYNADRVVEAAGPRQKQTNDRMFTVQHEEQAEQDQKNYCNVEMPAQSDSRIHNQQL